MPTLYTVCCARDPVTWWPGCPRWAHPPLRLMVGGAEQPQDSQAASQQHFWTPQNSYLSGPACPRSSSWATPPPPSGAAPLAPLMQPPAKGSSGHLLCWVRMQTATAVQRKEGKGWPHQAQFPGGLPSDPQAAHRMEMTQLMVMAFVEIQKLQISTSCCESISCSAVSVYNPMDCSPPGFSVHGTLQARILECVARSFSRGAFWPRGWTQVSCVVGRFFTISATRDATSCHIMAQMVPYLSHCKWPGLPESIRDAAESNRAGSYKAPPYPVVLPAEISQGQLCVMKIRAYSLQRPLNLSVAAV